MTRALLVADQDVPDLLGVEQRVVRRQDRAARDAEHHLRVEFLQRTHHRLRAGQPLHRHRLPTLSFWLFFLGLFSKKPLAQSAEGWHVIQGSDHVLHDYENSPHVTTVDYARVCVKATRAGSPSMLAALRVSLVGRQTLIAPVVGPAVKQVPVVDELEAREPEASRSR